MIPAIKPTHPFWRIAVLGVAVLLLDACGRGDPKEKFQATDISGAPWGRDFRLFDPSGAPRSLADYRGKVVMFFFGYTQCPDECPLTLAKMAQAVDRLGTDGKRVQGLFVTVDPARDSRAVLARYVPAFHPSFVGLSADAATTAAMAKDFKVFVALGKPDTSGSYTVDHNSSIFVFDAEGRLRLLMSQAVPLESMVNDLKLLLNEASTEGKS
jgi:protein SCO1/2